MLELAWSSGSRNVAYATYQGVFVHDLETGTEKQLIDSPIFPLQSDLAFSPNSPLLAFANKEIRIWDTNTWNVMSTVDDDARALAFSPDGHILASASGAKVILWDIESGQQLRSFTGENDKYKMREVAYAPNGELIAATNSVREVIVWKANTGEVQLRIEAQPAFSPDRLAFIPNGRLLAVAASSGLWLQLWDVVDGELIHTFVAGTYTDGIAINPRGNIVASAGGQPNIIEFWNLETKERIGQLEVAHKEWDIDMVNDIAFSPDGYLLASAGGAGSGVLIWGIKQP